MTTKPLTILGIETSCDETAAAVLKCHPNGPVEILSNIIHTQLEDHAGYGGVVPELAARAHVSKADHIIAQALQAADDPSGSSLDAVAATSGPGLIGGVMVGMMSGKALALRQAIPFIPINHLEGHALSAFLTEPVSFPYLLLLVSGGHTQLLHVTDIGRYQRLGTTIDDAVGEAFDKTAKLLNLGQPGGPQIEQHALQGDANRFPFPRPLLNRPTCDFSFSGLKTAVRTTAEKLTPLERQDVDDLAASFQQAATRHLISKTKLAMEQIQCSNLVLAGGVAANNEIKEQFNELTESLGWKLFVPPTKYCTDNGAMIALAGAKKIFAHGIPDQQDSIALAPKARWPLDNNPEGARHGSGKKGPKA